MSRRTAYRDLRALEDELGMPVWAEGGRWGLAKEAFLPAFRLTRGEAMAVFLAARLMAKYADAYDPELAAAFQKLGEALPDVLGRHVHRTLDVMARRPPDPEGARRLRALTQAWAERRVVELTYDASTYDPAREPRRARVRPVPHRAVHRDARALPDRVGRDEGRRPDVQARADPLAGGHRRPLRGAARTA